MSELSRFAAKLSELLKDDSLFLAGERINEDGLLVLTEDEAGREKRTVKLSDVPADAQIIKVDNFDLQGRFICTAGNSDVGKRCDYVIIDAQHSRILLIELKLGTKGDGERKQVVAQLKGGRVVIDYLVALIAHFHSESLDLNPEEFRYAWISYREAKTQKSESRANGRDIDSPMRLKNAQKTIYSFKRITR